MSCVWTGFVFITYYVPNEWKKYVIKCKATNTTLSRQFPNVQWTPILLIMLCVVDECKTLGKFNRFYLNLLAGKINMFGYHWFWLGLCIYYVM